MTSIKVCFRLAINLFHNCAVVLFFMHLEEKMDKRVLTLGKYNKKM